MLYAATIFLSSFLLFLVQPLVARLILPWFGGSAAVWTTCMLFFQALLLVGYAYAHLITKNAVFEKRKAIIHSVLLAAAVALLPIAPADSWKPAGDAEPVTRILLLLGATIGLPYLMLASTSPLLAAWFTRARPGENPYRLFAVSNLASLIALLGYPFLVEPVFTAHQQVTLWSWLFAGFAVLCAGIAWKTPQGALEESSSNDFSTLSKSNVLLWLVLAATGSALLLAVTNHLTQNVASVPLLWLAPLTIYLATFVIAFEGKGWYRPDWMWSVVLAALIGMTWLLIDAEFHYDLLVQLAIYLPGLFIGCLFCHGELYRLRPAPSQLTAFYLCVSAGGAIGGLLVAVAAPLAFNGYYELGAALLVLGTLAALRFAGIHRVAQVLSLLVLVAVSAGAFYDTLKDKRDVRVASRNFYGVLRVKEYGADTDTHLRRLVHGTIMHGEQYLTPLRRRELTTYYGEPSGIGAAIHSRQAGPKKGPVRVGVIGLGTGTIAAYGRKGDVYRFYDINARVISLAKSEFTYLADSPATIELALGDARLVLEREKPQQFDVLAVDAFSSDAIPVHLITREALAVYLRHVKPDGIVAYHVSNRFLDLIPVVARVAKENKAYAVLVRDDPEDEDGGGRSRSDWVLVSRDAAALRREPIEEAGAVGVEERPEWRTWTDDYSNLIQILK